VSFPLEQDATLIAFGRVRPIAAVSQKYEIGERDSEVKESLKILLISTFFVAIVLTICQLTSSLIIAKLAIGERYSANDFLDFVYVRNIGSSFGMFPGRPRIFAALAGAVIIGGGSYYIKRLGLNVMACIFLGMVIAGGLSNIIDTVMLGAAVDFIQIKGIPFWNFTFNFADVFILIGTCMLFLLHQLNFAKFRRKPM